MTGPYQLLPDLTEDEYADLKADIKKHGVQIPIMIDPAGNIIDGHHRSRAAAELKIACPTRTIRGTVDDFRSMALRLNVHRRSLTREQKRELLANSIKADPQLSDRQHAERTGASDKTAGVVRRELESTAEIPQSTTRVSADGRERPASQPVKITETTKVEKFVDPTTGEVLDPALPSPASTYVAEGPQFQGAEYIARFTQVLARSDDFLEFDAGRVGPLASDLVMQILDDLVDRTTRFVSEVRAARSGLRVVNGGKA